MLHAVLWVLWGERNRRVFENQALPDWKIILQVKELSWSWVMSEPELKGTRGEDVIFNWHSIYSFQLEVNQLVWSWVLNESDTRVEDVVLN